MNLQKGGVMVRLSNDFLQRLKDSVNINDIIGSYVDLKKKEDTISPPVLFMDRRKLLLFQCLRKRILLLLWLSRERGRLPFPAEDGRDHFHGGRGESS